MQRCWGHADLHREPSRGLIGQGVLQPRLYFAVTAPKAVLVLGAVDLGILMEFLGRIFGNKAEELGKGEGEMSQ